MPLADKDLAKEIADALAHKSPTPVSAFADILNALDALHKAGMTHRDLKPHNVLLHEGTWKLSDFGLVATSNPGSTSLTSTGYWAGTLAYMAPEQVLDMKNAKAPADIFAVGCMLADYYHPGPRVPHDQINAPGNIGHIMGRCTNKSPANHFQTVSSLRMALLPVIASPVHASTAIPASPVVDMSMISKWTKVEFAEFVDQMKKAAATDVAVAYESLDEPGIHGLAGTDDDMFRDFSEHYCEWARRQNLNFAFVDVMALRLMKIVDMGDISAKAWALLAIADMAYAHNRWFAMERLVDACGHGIDPNLASRLRIDILAEDMQPAFRACTHRLRKTIAVYHPDIASVLAPNTP